MAPQLMPATSLSHNHGGLKLHSKSQSKPSVHRVIFKILIAVVFVSLIYIAIAKNIVATCQSRRQLETSCPVPVKKRHALQFWKKERNILIDTDDSVAEKEAPSAFCRGAEVVFEYLPWLPGVELEEATTDEACQSSVDVKQKVGPIKRLVSKLKRKKNKTVSKEADGHYHKAFSTEVKITPAEQQLIAKVSEKVRNQVTDEQLEEIAWGGPGGAYWWWPQSTNPNQSGVSGLDGGSVLASYLRIMHWPEDMVSNFPFNLCSDGCSPERAIFHTMEWREKYKPWLMTPSALKENEDGFVYTRGHSQALSGDNSGHSMVWYRVGIHKVVDPEAYFRAILNALDLSIALNLKRSHNKVGKYNVVMDGNHFRFSMMPNLNDVKRGIVMMQDHFPDRLGMVFIANLSKPGEILFNLIMPFISKEVRDKIKLLPHDADKRQAALEAVVEKEFIPTWLGGSDSYEFDVETYYPSRLHWSEKEGRDYLQTMPYHA